MEILGLLENFKMNENINIDIPSQFIVEKSLKTKLLNGKINLANLILSKIVKYIIKDKDGRIIHTFNIPIHNKIFENEDSTSINYIGGEYIYKFPKKTKVGEIHCKLGNHLLSVWNYDMLHLKNTKMTFFIEPNQHLLRIS